MTVIPATAGTQLMQAWSPAFAGGTKKCVALLLAAVVLGGCEGRPADAAIPVAETSAGAISLTGRVVDRANLLNPADEQRLTTLSAELENETQDQLVVVTLPNLNGATIEQVALALGNEWGIGQSDLDNGVLLIVAPNERKVRIAVGLGLEGLLTDQRAAAIIQDMLPQFREGQPAQAISVGFDEIREVLRSDQRRPQRLLRKEAA